MRDTSRAGFAALALVFSVALAGSAMAQTSGQTPPAATPGAPQSAPSPDQLQTFIKELGNFLSPPASGTLSGFQPSVGAPVPQEVKTQPMPSGAAAALPDFKDHHVAKTDDQTILIVDPITREVVGVISVTDGSSTVGLGNPQPGSGASGAPAGGSTDTK